jgi:hypothetical protein
MYYDILCFTPLESVQMRWQSLSHRTTARLHQRKGEREESPINVLYKRLIVGAVKQMALHERSCHEAPAPRTLPSMPVKVEYSCMWRRVTARIIRTDMGTVYGMVLGPLLALFLLEKPSHSRSAHHRVRYGLFCGERACDKAAHCEDCCMEEETFSTMMLGASLCHNVSSPTETCRTVAPSCCGGAALFPDTEGRLHFFQGLQIFL